jgi:hypothetical protein
MDEFTKFMYTSLKKGNIRFSPNHKDPIVIGAIFTNNGNNEMFVGQAYDNNEWENLGMETLHTGVPYVAMRAVAPHSATIQPAKLMV